MKKENIISLLFYIPLGAILTYTNLNSDTEPSLLKSALFGYAGALSVFFIPYIFKNIRKNDKKNI